MQESLFERVFKVLQKRNEIKEKVIQLLLTEKNIHITEKEIFITGSTVGFKVSSSKKAELVSKGVRDLLEREKILSDL